MLFDEFEGIPEGLLDISVREIKAICPRPTLLHLGGRREPVLFVSLLLHGNEDVGLVAVQRLLKRYVNRELPRNLSLFIGNVDAAEQGVRYLSHQIDFNRAWPGSDLPVTPTHAMLKEITDRVVARGVFASIDLHNNTGRNPLYGCVSSLDAEHLQLASMFSRTVVYFTRPKGVQTGAFIAHCPSVTCECGKIGDESGVEHAVELIDACLHQQDFVDHQLAPGDIHIFHTVARIQIRNGCSIAFHPDEADIVFRNDLDALNFVELKAGDSLANVLGSMSDDFHIRDESGRDVTNEFLICKNGHVQFRRDTMPSMLTRNIEVIRQDCLGYLMERWPQPTEAL